MTTTLAPYSPDALEQQQRANHQLFPSEIEEMQSQTHEQICAEFTSMLRRVFESDENANVGGDTGFYWNNQDDRERIAPDAYLIRNAGKTPRKSWKLWEERQTFPNLSIRFVLEVWSDDNKLAERRRKLRQYQALGAQEFFELDSVTGDLAGQRLINGQYETLDATERGGIFSQELQAEITFEDGLLRLYRNGERVLTASEERELRQKREKELQSQIDRLQKELDALKKFNT